MLPILHVFSFLNRTWPLELFVDPNFERIKVAANPNVSMPVLVVSSLTAVVTYLGVSAQLDGNVTVRGTLNSSLGFEASNMTFLDSGSGSNTHNWQFLASYEASTNAKLVDIKVTNVVLSNYGCVVYSENICDIAEEVVLEALSDNDNSINEFLNSELQSQIKEYFGRGKFLKIGFRCVPIRSLCSIASAFALTFLAVIHPSQIKYLSI